MERTSKSQIDDEALIYAQQASVGAINDPINLFSTQQRLLHLPAVKALQKSPSTAPLYDLLKIIHEGKLQDYRDFTAMPDKSGVFASFQLNEAECTKNMSLLSLVSLAGEHEEIPYSAIASTLEIPEEQVEKWVILGVSSGLMEAKMDQLSKVVIVERCVVRQFGPKEWEALKVRLDKWKVNVRGVLEALKKSGAGTLDGQ
jgi:translation initiation factor 3 subunit M